MKNRILRLLFPPRCEACMQPLDWYTAKRDTILCPACNARLASERALTCDQCAKRIDECGCMPTLLLRAGCKGFYKLVKYYPNRSDYVQNRLLYTVKKQPAPRIHAYLARELAPAVALCRQMAENQNVVLTYLPRAPRAVRKNGTDQAKMLALALSLESGIPARMLLTRARRGGAVQKRLSLQERVKNAKTLFALSKGVDLSKTTVILVDDLVTTGSSMAEALRLLKQAGGTQFFCIGIAVDA